MEKVFVDTNIFVEVFARTGQKSDKCRRLIEKEENLWTSELVISEVEWVLRYSCKLERSQISRCLKIIVSSNIEVEDKALIVETVDFYERNSVDWTDCLNMFLVRKMEREKVYSYDVGFKKYKWINRLEP